MRQLILTVVAVCLSLSVCRADPGVEKRIDSLLVQMTHEEKISLIHGDSYFNVAGVRRLGIPPRVMSDGPHGIREETGPHNWNSQNRSDDYVTALPVASCLAATWNVDLARQAGEMHGREARARARGGIDFPYTYFWMFRQLYAADTHERDIEALKQMRDKWKYMMSRTDTGTLVESFGGGEACHNFGASPAYFLSAYVLGARLDGPASERRLIIEPRLGDLARARGIVVTEVGTVDVEWTLTPQGALDFTVAVPDGATATLRLPGISPATLTINGTSITPTLTGRWSCVPLTAGVHRGTVNARAQP
jgi:hypothetical protein